MSRQEKYTASSTFSFRHTWVSATNWVRHRDSWWGMALMTMWAFLFITAAWSFVALWYIMVFGMFGVLVLPFRILTRGGRRRERLAKQQLVVQSDILAVSRKGSD